MDFREIKRMHALSPARPNQFSRPLFLPPTWSLAILCNSALNGSTVVYTCCLKVLHFRNYKKTFHVLQAKAFCVLFEIVKNYCSSCES